MCPDIGLMSSALDTQTEYSSFLLPGIVVLNYNYFPDSAHSASKVGATAFAMSAVQVLKDAHAFLGMILYKRQEDIEAPIITTEIRSLATCAIVSFYFGMQARFLEIAISTASDLLLVGSARPPMLYYQTDTLLDYHPNHLPFCVTHHGPFYDHFAGHFSEDLAAVAFGSRQKARHLQTQQRSGVEHLKTRKHGFVLQHSELQGNYLRRCGVDPSKMFELCPPIHSMRLKGYPVGVSASRNAVVDPDRVFLFTAVARLDYFKNIDLLVDAAVELMSRGQSLNVLIAGDGDHDSIRRHKLLERVPTRYAKSFEVIPKMSKDALYTLFEDARRNGIFICPSRYETLGITPLEAALNGVTTVISDTMQVEAARYFPERYRFVPTAIELANLVESIINSRVDQCGKELCHYIENRISDESFKLGFLHAWMTCSQKVGPSTRL